MALIALTQRFIGQPQYAPELAEAYQDAELLSLFNDGSGHDIAKGNHLVPGTGVAPSPAVRQQGKALSFDGSTSRLISTRPIPNAAQFTVLAWVRPAALNTVYSRILETNFISQFYLGSNTGSKYAWIVNNSAVEGCVGGQQVVGQRDFLAGVFDGTSAKLYVNGVQVGSVAAVTPSTSTYMATGYSNASGVFAWKGDIDTVGVFNRAFPAPEIWSLYQDPWRLFKAPLRRLWTSGSNLIGDSSIQVNSGCTAAIAQVYALTGAVSALSANPVKLGEEFFGMSVQLRVNDGLAGVTAKVTRSHDLKSGTSMWKYIEVSDNAWNWTNIDSWVNTHYAAGRELVFTLYGTPAWASARPAEQCVYGPSYLGIASEPGDMTKWSRFCTQIATRYLGKIKYYEIWNEPNYQNNGASTTGSSFFFSGTFTKLAEMVRLAAQAIKGVDPTAKIISPAVTTWSATAGQSAETYFIGMMNAGDGASGTMKDWVDIVGVHLYLPGNDQIQNLAGMIDRINAAKATAGVLDKETWDTESAPIGPGIATLTDDAAKTLIARSMLTAAAKGIARTIYYQYDHDTMGYINRPQIAAYREQIVALLRSGDILSVSRFADGRVAYCTNLGTTII